MKAASLPRLGRGAVDLEDRQVFGNVWPPVRKRVQACTEDDVLVDARANGHSDRVLDEAGPDCEGKAKRLARRFWELRRQMSQEPFSSLAGQPEREVVHQQRPVALTMDGAAHCRQGRRVPGPGFDFLQLLLHRGDRDPA